MPPVPRPLRCLAPAASLCALTLAALAAVFVLANLGMPPALLWLLLALPLTLGLPTTGGVLAVTSLWDGPPLWLFVALAAAAGFALQLAVHLTLRRWRRRRSP